MKLQFKIRPLVLTIGLYVAALVAIFGWQLLTGPDVVLDTQALGLLFGTGLGGLLMLAGLLATDPPGASVPAGTHSRVLASVMGITVETIADTKHPLRLTVLILATLAAILTLIFGLLMIARLEIGISRATLVAILIGIGVGGLLTLAGKLATEDPPPTVPAETYERDVTMIVKRDKE